MPKITKAGASDRNQPAILEPGTPEYIAAHEDPEKHADEIARAEQDNADRINGVPQWPGTTSSESSEKQKQTPSETPNGENTPSNAPSTDGRSSQDRTESSTASSAGTSSSRGSRTTRK